MDYFKKYVSNTTAGSGNQLFFIADDANKVQKSRLFYRINKGGKYSYSFLFSNIIDSTYSDGKFSHKNLIVDSWDILGMGVRIFSECSEESLAEEEFIPLTFKGEQCKEVMPCEFFATDPIELSPSENEYICIQIEFKGSMIPYHEESLIPTFVFDGDEWKPSKLTPFPGMIGCERNVKLRVGFLGDSITQGCGTEINSYTHWNAKLAQMLGNGYAYWNLGLGYGRANDAASDGAWLFKAKQNDVAVVCYGVNDIMQNMPEEQIKKDLGEIVLKLKASGVKVVLQTVPPFNYEGEKIEKWKRINRYIKDELSKECDMLFDNAQVLSLSSEAAHKAAFGPHPNAEGCLAWANKFYPVLKSFLEIAEKQT